NRSSIRFPTDDLLSLHRSLEALRSECCDIQRVVEKSRKRQLQIRIVEPSWRPIADQAALLYTPNPGLKCDGVVTATKIQPRHIERCQGTDFVISQRTLAASSHPGLKFEADAVIERIPLGFLQLDQHILARLRALRVLHRGIH